MALGAVDTICEFDEPYRTPQGFYDVPYVYAKNYFFSDLDPLISAGGVPPIALNNELVDAIPSDGDSDFILRKVGTTLTATPNYTFNFRDATGTNYFSNPAGFNPGGGTQLPFDPFAVCPEKLYPAGAGIRYAIGAGSEIHELLEFGGVTPFIAYFSVMFQGVKRFAGTPDRRPNYQYWERCWTYVQPFNLNWTYLVPPTFSNYTENNLHTLTVPVKDYDFELMQIGCDFANTVLFGFQMTLFDANTRALSNVPVDMSSCLSGVGAVGASPPAFQGSNVNCFPVPSIVYPKGSVIRMDIRSLVSTRAGQGNTGGACTIYLKGVSRIPC